MNRRPPKNGVKRVKEENILLVDGNALFKTGYFGAKDLYNSEGKHVGGVYQFITTLRKIISEDLYHKVYVFWDGNFSGKLRYDIYKPYKSSRGKNFITGTQPIEQSELEQRRIVWDYLNEMYVRQLKNEIVEGDDYIAFYCNNKKENENITILTNDRDMAQLISEKIKVYFLDIKDYVGMSNFSSYFCYHVKNAALVKIMTGDSSDDIKGIKGVGLKGLVKLFPIIAEREVSLEEIIELAKIENESRIQAKKKPLSALTNIINSVTDGEQGTKIYEINEKLVNLKKPMLTEEGVQQLVDLMDGTLDSSGRELKNVLVMMKRDGLDKIIGETRYPEYLLPFKRLINREN